MIFFNSRRRREAETVGVGLPGREECGPSGVGGGIHLRESGNRGSMGACEFPLCC